MSVGSYSVPACEHLAARMLRALCHASHTSVTTERIEPGNSLKHEPPKY